MPRYLGAQPEPEPPEEDHAPTVRYSMSPESPLVDEAFYADDRVQALLHQILELHLAQGRAGFQGLVLGVVLSALVYVATQVVM